MPRPIDHNLSWSERLREWLWPWFPAFVIGAILALAFVRFFPWSQRIERAECKRLYSEAHAIGDSLVVDATVPFNEAGKDGVKCGERRRLGELK